MNKPLNHEAEKTVQTTSVLAVDPAAPCSACNGKGYFRIGTGEAKCRKCHPEPEEEDRRPIALMRPTLLFDEDTAKSIDWRAYYDFLPNDQVELPAPEKKS